MHVSFNHHDVPRIISHTRPSRFSACNIDKLGMGLGTRLTCKTDIHMDWFYYIMFILLHIHNMILSTVHTTTSPCTPVITSSSNLSQAGLVSPSGSTPHSSTPYTSLTNTTPINSTSVAILSTPQGSYAQPVDQILPGAQYKLPYTPQHQQQASNGIYVQDAGMGGVGGVAMGYVGIGGSNLSSPQTMAMAGLDATGKSWWGGWVY